MSTLDPDAVVRAFPDVRAEVGRRALDVVDEGGGPTEASAAAVRRSDLVAVRTHRRRRDVGRSVAGGIVVPEGDGDVVQAIVEVPLVVHDTVVGALAVAATTASGRTYGDEDVALVKAMADRIALAYDNGLLFASQPGGPITAGRAAAPGAAGGAGVGWLCCAAEDDPDRATSTT